MQLRSESEAEAIGFIETQITDKGEVMLAGEELVNVFRNIRYEKVLIRTDGETATFDFSKFKENYQALCKK